MNYYLVEIYTAAERELERAKDDERDARRAQVKSLWGRMGAPERALAQKAHYQLAPISTPVGKDI